MISSILIDIAVISTLSLFFGGILGYASHYFKVESSPLIEQIDAILPQSQCGKCGYPGCRSYAEVVGNNGEAINKCTPGGVQTMLKLAKLLNVEPQPLDKKDENKKTQVHMRTFAWINEENCIGCVKCIKICPVDAIIGTRHAMHTILNDICIGCNLCIPPCPTNCIEIRPIRYQYDIKLKKS